MKLPEIANTISEVRHAVRLAKQAGKTVGFVPTMGALHEGHGQLIREAHRENGFVVVSIFVNPTQFGPKEDFSRYPRTFEADRQLCGEVGADLIFAPTPAEMYPPGFTTFVEVEKLQEGLCGASRPGHFRGVATVVLKLFNIVKPDIAYFGQKDAQQARILQQMTKDLDVDLVVKVVPTVREADGLAMSSRNRYLDPEQRQHATVLSRALNAAQAKVQAGERSVVELQTMIEGMIQNTSGARLDYAQIVDAETFQPVTTLTRPALAALAVFFGTTRLIDNMILTP